jgi:hypothetical protein
MEGNGLLMSEIPLNEKTLREILGRGYHLYYIIEPEEFLNVKRENDYPKDFYNLPLFAPTGDALNYFGVHLNSSDLKKLKKLQIDEFLGSGWELHRMKLQGVFGKPPYGFVERGIHFDVPYSLSALRKMLFKGLLITFEQTGAVFTRKLATFVKTVVDETFDRLLRYDSFFLSRWEASDRVYVVNLIVDTFPTRIQMMIEEDLNQDRNRFMKQLTELYFGALNVPQNGKINEILSRMGYGGIVRSDGKVVWWNNRVVKKLG